MAVLKWFFFVFFVASYAKGREASNNLYTVYTANYTSLTYIPLHPSASYQDRTPTFKEKTPQTLCSATRSSPDRVGGIQTIRNKINRKWKPLLTVIYNLCNSIYDFDIFWNHQDQSIIRYPD